MRQRLDIRQRLHAIGWRRSAALLGAIALVGVLGAGTVLAQSPTGPTASPTPAPAATSAPRVGQAPIVRRLAATRMRWIRAAEYASVTVKTKDGTQTLEYVRGDITSLGSDSLVVTAADHTAFTIDVTGTTRIRTFRRKLAFADLQVGQHAIVLAQESGGAYTGRIVLAWPAPGSAAAPMATPSPAS